MRELQHHEVAPRTFEFINQEIWFVTVKVGGGSFECQKSTDGVCGEKSACDVDFGAPGEHGIAIFSHEPGYFRGNAILVQAGEDIGKAPGNFP